MSPRPAWLAATLAVDLAAAAALVLLRSMPEPPLDPVAVAATEVTASTLGSGLRPPAARLRVAPRVRVPALEVDAAVVRLGTGRDGSLQVPATATDVGLWSAGPQPGDPGAAVLVGHVDLDGRPGVFAGLRRLRAGDVVTVRRDDGRDVGFRVERVERVRKTAFPTDAVYAPTAEPTLRLVTCGGAYDRRTGHYRDNVVVYASAV